MSHDPKTSFYLAHREQIEQWAALRDPAAAALDRALLAGVHRLATQEGVPALSLSEGRHTYARVPVPLAPDGDVAIELGWFRQDLLKLTNGWPTLRVSVNPAQSPAMREAVKEATITGYSKHGLTETTTGWWLRCGELFPVVALDDFRVYADDCVQRWHAAYVDLAPRIRQALDGMIDQD